MEKQLLLKYLTAFVACIVGVFGTHEARAQSPIYGGSVGTGSNFQLILGQAGSSAPTPYIHMFGCDNGDNGNQGSINYIAGYNSNSSGVAHSFVYRTAGGGYPRAMQIFQDGKILIGGGSRPSSRPNYTLAVAGEIAAQSLYITSPSSWADFVFEPTHKILTLRELETYLLNNKHLPAIPSAVEVKENGYSITEMDTKLLQSIEELTLHVIKLSKQNEQLSKLSNQTQLELIKLRSQMRHTTSRRGR